MHILDQAIADANAVQKDCNCYGFSMLPTAQELAAHHAPRRNFFLHPGYLRSDNQWFWEQRFDVNTDERLVAAAICDGCLPVEVRGPHDLFTLNPDYYYALLDRDNGGFHWYVIYDGECADKYGDAKAKRLPREKILLLIAASKARPDRNHKYLFAVPKRRPSMTERFQPVADLGLSDDQIIRLARDIVTHGPFIRNFDFLARPWRRDDNARMRLANLALS